MIDLAELRQRLLTQDNAGTSHPVFIVERKVREYGYDGNYHDATPCWVNSDDDLTFTADSSEENEYGWTFKRLEQFDSDLEDPPEGWSRTHYVDRWEYVQAFLTREGADDYMASERHNLGVARVYVGSADRNPEWQAIRELLMGRDIDELIAVFERRRQRDELHAVIGDGPRVTLVRNAPEPTPEAMADVAETTVWQCAQGEVTQAEVDARLPLQLADGFVEGFIRDRKLYCSQGLSDAIRMLKEKT